MIEFEVWGDSHFAEPSRFFGLGAADAIRTIASAHPELHHVGNYAFPGAKVGDFIGNYARYSRAPVVLVSAGTNEAFAAHNRTHDGQLMTNWWHCLKELARQRNQRVIAAPAQNQWGLASVVPAMVLYRALPASLGFETIDWNPTFEEMASDGIHYNSRGSHRMASLLIGKVLS